MSSWTTTSSKVGAVLFVAAIASCGGPRAANDNGSGGPDFALRDLDGRMVRLSDHRGSVVLVNFWATWCVPCAAELPHLERLYQEYRDQGLVVLAVSMDGPESAANVPSFARRHGLTFPVLVDEETRVVGRYNPKRTAPFTMIVGRDGLVAKRREGYHAGDEVAIEEDIRGLLAGRDGG